MPQALVGQTAFFSWTQRSMRAQALESRQDGSKRNLREEGQRVPAGAARHEEQRQRDGDGQPRELQRDEGQKCQRPRHHADDVHLRAGPHQDQHHRKPKEKDEGAEDEENNGKHHHRGHQHPQYFVQLAARGADPFVELLATSWVARVVVPCHGAGDGLAAHPAPIHVATATRHVVATTRLLRGDATPRTCLRAMHGSRHVETLLPRDLKPVRLARSADMCVGVVVAELRLATRALHLRNDVSFLLHGFADHATAGALPQLAVPLHLPEALELLEVCVVGEAAHLLNTHGGTFAAADRADDGTDPAVGDQPTDPMS
mmetsp:Transcript_32719/g.84129  ORF Transcript_32719/g.84129 Transcript_32719/m.84129 type:complete len:316 (+) Transcript_32719:3-950(+)